MIKTRIRVPESHEDIAKMYGAKYDGRMKSWYIPEDKAISTLWPFIPLSIELVPSSNWENNVRSEYADEWDEIRRAAYKSAGHKCEVCGKSGDEQPVEAHEVWSYDMNTYIQKLLGIDVLCPMCHRTKHYGLALISSQEKEIKKHLMKINQWTEADVEKYLKEVFGIYDVRSKINWTLDFSVLGNMRLQKAN